ncbi:HPF/RaiA family ribosome-associated protein [Mucilaginibacter sp. UYCu711]|uniref:HPF/RaiA family ribosome-associated protein n=1 Tax=Mucilaginibacter sp. UYCu711 TaxID=3156339 RepID=UPI003D2277C6
MQIQINTDHNIDGNERLNAYFETKITDALSRFEQHLTRIEAHLTDENGEKKGKDEKRCLLEARLEGMEPIAVSGLGDNIEQAVGHALEKMKAKLVTVTGKLKEHI